jgi:hypothetical protein
MNSIAGCTMLGATASLFVPPEKVCVCWEGKYFGFNHKIMIKVQESPPNIMVTKNLWYARV